MIVEDAIAYTFHDGGFPWPNHTSAIHVFLRNVGTTVSVIHGIKVDILYHRKLLCCESAGAPLVTSATYNLTLPVANAVGQTLDIELSQELRPHTADRVALIAWLPSEVLPSPHAHLYQLRLRLLHDVPTQELDLGKVVLMVGTDRAQEFFTLPDPDGWTRACLNANRAALAEAMQLQGARAQTLDIRALSVASAIS